MSGLFSTTGANQANAANAQHSAMGLGADAIRNAMQRFALAMGGQNPLAHGMGTLPTIAPPGAGGGGQPPTMFGGGAGAGGGGPMPAQIMQILQMLMGPQTQMPTAPGQPPMPMPGGPQTQLPPGSPPIMTGQPQTQPQTGFGPAPAPMGNIPSILLRMGGGGAGQGGIEGNGPAQQYRPR